MVTALDDGIGRILRAVAEEGIAENTLVVFLSDNGGALPFGADNSPWRGGKGQLYEGGVRVPAAMHWPAGGLVGGRSIAGRVGYIDLLPTLAMIAGAPIPESVDGSDLSPLLFEDRTLEPRDWYALKGAKGLELIAVTSGSWKLIHFGESAALDEHPTGKIELYNLASDPGETTDLVEQHPKIVKELFLKVHKFRLMAPSAATADFYDGAPQQTRDFHALFSQGKAPDDLNDAIPGVEAPVQWRIPSL